MQNTSRPDDLYDDYVAMGIIEPEDNDTFPCAKCGASIMPWWLRCEACGTSEYRPRNVYDEGCDDFGQLEDFDEEEPNEEIN